MKKYILNLLLCYRFAAGEDALPQNISDLIFEGDIIADFETINSVYDNGTVSKLIEEGVIEEEPNLFKGATPRFQIWNMDMNGQDLYVIRVYIDPYGYTTEHMKTIKKALKKMQRKTGVIKFKFLRSKPTDGRPFLNYGRHTGGMCASQVGRKSSSVSVDGQFIYLELGCLSIGTVQHETMHALGTYAYGHFMFSVPVISLIILQVFGMNKIDLIEMST